MDISNQGNFWVSSNLWLTIYCLEEENREKAMKHYGWVVGSATDDFLLSQQIDKNGKPRSAIPYGLVRAREHFEDSSAAFGFMAN